MARFFSEETRRKMAEAARKRGNSEAWIHQMHTFVPFCSSEDLGKAYNERNLTQQEIADEYRVTLKRVQTAMRKFGIFRRKAAPAQGKFTGDKCPRWKGGRVLQGTSSPSPYSDRGYWYIWNPEHPRAGKGGYVAEHIVVAMGKIGRPILPSEFVHHLDLNKHNNSPENLIVCPKVSHGQYHRQLELIAVRLYRQGRVVFSQEKGYELIEDGQ